jgi:hypothetical protein
VLFPIYAGYWTLLVLNIRSKKAKYFDPIGIAKNDSVVSGQLFALMKREIKLRERKDIENTRWLRMEFERVNEFEVYEHTDSAVYVLRQAFRLAICKDIQVRPELLANYRQKLLKYLYKYSNKITY